MGYTTNFSGHLALSRPLTIAEAKTLLGYSEDPDSINVVHPDSYLQWVPSESLDAIVFDGGEKFYNYSDWMLFTLHFLSEAEIRANGVIQWQGEDTGDVGLLTVIDNGLTVTKGSVVPKTNFKPLTIHSLAHMALKQVAA